MLVFESHNQYLNRLIRINCINSIGHSATYFFIGVFSSGNEWLKRSLIMEHTQRVDCLQTYPNNLICESCYERFNGLLVPKLAQNAGSLGTYLHLQVFI